MRENPYRQLQDAWVSGNNGTTWQEIALVLTQVPLSVFFACIFCKNNSLFRDFIFIILPMIYTVTDVFQNGHIIPKTLSVLMVCYLVFSFKFSFRSLKREMQCPPTTTWFTNFRSSVYLLTAVNILAVDFTIYPRRFMKTETYGISLMDVGVGAFILCNAIRTQAPLSKTLKGASILLVLGVLRLLSTRSVDYQHHVSEYGVHWNFFFTLAACRILTGILEYFFPRKQFWLAFFTLIMHQSILNSGKEHWVLSSAPRNDLISANREGIVSILGYVALYFNSAAVLTFIRRAQSRLTLILRLLLCCTFWWILFLACLEGDKVSRRLCNTCYTAWILAIGCLLLLQFIIVEFLVAAYSFKAQVPLIMAAVNYSGLFFFLIANLLTGLITMNVQTLLLPPEGSYFVLISYSFVICYVMRWLYVRDIKIKFW